MSEASYPDGLYYNEEHDWARVDGDVATFGITWYAQDSLGEVVYFAPSEVGTTIERGGEYGELESTKAVSQLIAPLSGEVTAVNEAVSETPELINEDPYEAGWLVKVRLTNAGETDSLLDAATYKAQLELGE